MLRLLTERLLISIDREKPRPTLTITPNTISENNYIKQNIKIEITRKNENDPALNYKKAIENTLEVKDGRIALMLFKPGEGIYSSSGNTKNDIYSSLPIL